MTESPALLTARRAAELLGVSESTVRRGVTAGTIPTTTIVEGGDRLIPLAFVRELRGD